MLRRTSLGCGLLVLLFVFSGFTDKRPPVATASDLIEFPVLMQQKITAGVTPVGTKVQAKLTIPTLVHGTVVPRDAVLSGEITESVAKSADAPSKLGIRMDMAQWKNGSLPVKVYLTEWYYPMKSMMGEDNNPNYQGAMHGSVGITMGGGGGNNPQTFPTSTTRTGGRFPDDDSVPFPNTTDPGTMQTSDPSPHRSRIPDVESKRAENGAIVLLSKKGLKLDKNTTYVLASDSLSPRNLSPQK
jgi:hypothetical protein